MAVTLALCVALPVLVRRVKNRKLARAIGIAIAIAILVNEIIYYIWTIRTVGVDKFVAKTLPLHVSAFGMYLTALSLIFRKQFLYEVAYYWVLIAMLQAVITPNILENFPEYRFFEFFVNHSGSVIGIIYCTWGLRMRPRPRSVITVALFTIVFATLVGSMNVVLDANYMFLCRPPRASNPLFFLPWPRYLAFLFPVSIVFMTILYMIHPASELVKHKVFKIEPRVKKHRLKEKKIRAVIFGATGLAGSGVLEECLKHPRVEKVTLVSRREIDRKHRKLKQVIHKDFMDYSAVMDELKGHNACFYCLGISQSDVPDEKLYTQITYDYTMAAASALIGAGGEDRVTMCFLSGQGTDSNEKSVMMWARIKGKAENDLGDFAFKKLYNFRPSYIHPVHGQKMRYSVGGVYKALYPVINKLFPEFVITTEEFGKGMINSVLFGYRTRILENLDIRRAAGFEEK